jgi:hypothetical protein
MKIAQRQLLIACLALLFGGNALANDPPKDAPKADAKKEEKKDEAKKDEKKDEAKKDGKDGKEPAKAEAPAEPDLPSKPYPKNATPKAFVPKGEPKKFDEGTAAAKPEDKPAEKAADKGDKHGADKHAADKHGADKPADKAADHGDKGGEKQAVVLKPAPKKRKPVAAAPKPVTDPAMATVARETLQSAAPTGAYQVKAGDNLDKVIKKTMPNTPFSMEVMREAFARANPQLLGEVKAMKLKPGSTLNVPGASVLRQVVLGDPAPQAEVKQIKAVELHRAAPVVAPTVAPTASDLNPPIAIPRQAPNVAYNGPAPEVSAEEKKKWVRFP